MKVLLRKCSRRMAHNGLMEWSANGRVWYPIATKKIIPQNNGDFYESFRRAMNKVYEGCIEVFEGFYDPTKKILSVKKLEV